MKFLQNKIKWLVVLILCIGCKQSTASDVWVELSEYVKVRTFSEYTEGEYLQVRVDFSENGKNPVYAIGQKGYNHRLEYFNSSIIEDLTIKDTDGERTYPFDMLTERNFGYKEYLTVLFYFSVDKEKLDEIEYIEFSDNCFGIGKVKLELRLQ